jgi:two-component system phosphate regulon response regulator OmpR
MPEQVADDGAPKYLSLGPIRYDTERAEMWRGEDLVRLTSTEIQLMKVFAARPGEALSRTQLVEELGRDRGQSQERAVDVQITRLRRKLEDNPKQPRYLQTVRGAGYMLAPD